MLYKPQNLSKWISYVRKKFGKVSTLRCWEASRKGYPHIHVLMVFHDYQFKIAFSQLKKTRYGSYRRIYRIHEKDVFEKSYHSYVDVEAVRKLRKGITYISKYLTKTNDENQSQILTLVLCWLFKKRSFAVSGDFYEVIYSFINIRCRLIQTDLFGNKLQSSVVWVFIGIFSASRLGIARNLWYTIIADKEVLKDILT